MKIPTSHVCQCDFCSKTEHEVVKMIGHGNIHICIACLELSLFVLNLHMQPEYQI